MSDMDIGGLKDSFVTLGNRKRVIAVTGVSRGYGCNNVGSIITQTVEDHQIDLGNVFTVRKIVTIPAGISNIILDTSGVGEKSLVILPPNFKSIGGDKVIIHYYVSSTYTKGDGIEVVPTNRNQTSTKTAESKIIEFPDSINTPGIKAPIEWLIESNAIGISFTSGSAGSKLPFEIIKGTNHRLQINNTDTNPQDFEYNLTIFELPLYEVE